MPSSLLGAEMPSARLHCVLQCLGAEMPSACLHCVLRGRFLPYYQCPGAARQRDLLEEEGIEFVKEKIDLKKYGWDGQDQAEAAHQERLF